MELIRKLRGLITKPKSKLWWAAHNFGRIPLLIRRRRPGALLGYFVAGGTGRRVYDYYIEFLARRSGGTVEREIRGNRMELNLQDEGLSRDLFIYGVREERGVDILERELKQVADSIDDGVVLEIGANIGYFALTELAALDSSTSLVAFEPDEQNASLLERNLELNGYQDIATIERAAVGPECDTVEFELSTHSNLNKVQTASTADPDYDTGRTITVDMWSIDEYLEANNIDPGSVVAARMDVEGYEVEVVRGMERLLAADGPTILSLEIHPSRLDSEDIIDLAERIDEHGFELVEALTEDITVYPFVKTCIRDVDIIQSIPTDGPAYNLILTKPPSSQGSAIEPEETSVSTADKTVSLD